MFNSGYKTGNISSFMSNFFFFFGHLLLHESASASSCKRDPLNFLFIGTFRLESTL